VIEVASAAAVAWQFSAKDHEARERTALRIIAISFFALAAYVTVESARALLGGDAAEHSTVGIVLAAVSLLVMPGLSYIQRRTGRELGSATAVADSKRKAAKPGEATTAADSSIHGPFQVCYRSGKVSCFAWKSKCWAGKR
jgi:hypothetical protein